VHCVTVKMPITRINTESLGEVTYKSLGALGAGQLNSEVTLKTIPHKTKSGETKLISAYKLFNENKAAIGFNASPSKATNGVELYKVIYTTTIPENNRQYKTSGLLAIPNVPDRSLPLVSWQHGTEQDPKDAPSELARGGQIQRSPAGVPRSAETLFNVNSLAGNGYIVAAADYIGNGGSKAKQPFAVKGATVQTIKDMLTASKAVLNDLGLESQELYLNGWSQGGMNTQWLGSQLQEDRTAVRGQSVVSGPSDVNKNVSYWFNDFPGQPAWLTSSVVPLLLGAYEKYYGIKDLMAKAIRTEYLETAKKIYNKEINWDEVVPEKEGEGVLGLPAKPRDMITGKFIRQYNNGEGAFYRKTIENTALEVEYPENNYFFGGSKDTIVPLDISVDIPTAFQESLGSTTAKGINTGDGATHSSTFLASLYGMRNEPTNNILTWFASN
jgi:hypothetical protein